MRPIILGSLAALLCVTAATDTHAVANIGLRGAGGRLSFVNPSDIDGTIGLDLIADWGTLRPQLAVETTLDFWSSEEDFGFFEVDVRAIAVGGRLKYTFNVTDHRVRPYVAGGLALHFLRFETPTRLVFGVPVAGRDDSDTKLGIDFAGGVGYKTNPNLFVVGELRVRLVADVSQVMLAGGVVYWFN